MDPKYKYTQAIILMTDGLNTQNRWYTSQNSIDTRQATTCTNAKAAGITVYTVQVNTGGDPTSTLLKNCATTQQVLPADLGEPDGRHLPADRHRALQSAHRAVTAPQQHESPAERPGFLFICVTELLRQPRRPA